MEPNEVLSPQYKVAPLTGKVTFRKYVKRPTITKNNRTLVRPLYLSSKAQVYDQGAQKAVIIGNVVSSEVVVNDQGKAITKPRTGIVAFTGGAITVGPKDFALYQYLVLNPGFIESPFREPGRAPLYYMEDMEATQSALYDVSVITRQAKAILDDLSVAQLAPVCKELGINPRQEVLALRQGVENTIDKLNKSDHPSQIPAPTGTIKFIRSIRVNKDSVDSVRLLADIYQAKERGFLTYRKGQSEWVLLSRDELLLKAIDKDEDAIIQFRKYLESNSGKTVHTQIKALLAGDTDVEQVRAYIMRDDEADEAAIAAEQKRAEEAEIAAQIEAEEAKKKTGAAKNQPKK